MWFKKAPAGTSVALIDLSASSVAGALVRLTENENPLLCYTFRLPIESTTTNPDALSASTLRALEALGERLIKEGAPALRTCVGEGSVDSVIVSLGSPWQEARVDTKKIQKDAEFAYTKSFAAELLGQPQEIPGKELTRTVITTMLNGYATEDPYGKSAKRAEAIVLSTYLSEEMMNATDEILRKCFHTRDISYTSFTDPAYRAVRTLYPHERDFLLLSITGDVTDIMSVKRGHLLDAGTVLCGKDVFSSGKTCAAVLGEKLREFATRHALPRTIFILASDSVMETTKEALNDESLRALWLSDVPLSTLPLDPAQFTPRVTVTGLGEGDARLAILALSTKP